MSHADKIVDMDPHFDIDTRSRDILITSPEEVNLVQYDHDSERFSFTLPRFVEGHDMLECNSVQVHYINVDAATKKENKGLYEIQDLRVCEESEDMVCCTWLISQNVTKVAGVLQFLLRFACVGNDGLVKYAWNTNPYTKISITAGINNSEEIAEQYADILEQWRIEILNSAGIKTQNNTEIFNDYENNKTNIPFAHIEGRNNKAIVKSFPIRVAENNKVIFTNFNGDNISVGDAWNIFYIDPNDGWVYKLRGFIEEFDEYSSETELYFYAVLNGDDLSSFVGRESENTFLMTLIVKGGTVGSQEVSADDMPTNYTAHLEGYDNIGFLNTHVTGARNQALGYNSMAHGFSTAALGERSSSKGYKTKASGHESDAKGQQTEAKGYASSAKGSGTVASGLAASSEGSGTIASGDESHSQGISTKASGRASTSMGGHTTASGDYATSMGSNTVASGENSLALGSKSKSPGKNSIGFGNEVTATGENSLVGGYKSEAKGPNSLVVGNGCLTEYENSAALGSGAQALWHRSFAFGEGVIASSTAAMATGINTKASGKASFTTGWGTEAQGECGTAEGKGTFINGAIGQHVQGRYNDKNNTYLYAHIVGGGDSEEDRKNIHTLDWRGNAWFAGTVECTEVIMKSPNGTRFKIVVDDNGNLSTARI